VHIAADVGDQIFDHFAGTFDLKLDRHRAANTVFHPARGRREVAKSVSAKEKTSDQGDSHPGNDQFVQT
jgi:hypothetical protein